MLQSHSPRMRLKLFPVLELFSVSSVSETPTVLCSWNSFFMRTVALGFTHTFCVNVASDASAHLCSTNLGPACVSLVCSASPCLKFLSWVSFNPPKPPSVMCFFPFAGDSLHPLVLPIAGATVEFAAEGHTQMEMWYQLLHLICTSPRERVHVIPHSSSEVWRGGYPHPESGMSVAVLRPCVSVYPSTSLRAP